MLMGLKIFFVYFVNLDMYPFHVSLFLSPNQKKKVNKTLNS